MDNGENNLELKRARVDSDEKTTSSGFEDFHELNFDPVADEGSRMDQSSPREEDLVRIQSDVEDERFQKLTDKLGSTRGKQVIRRSNLLAKQVISIRSALSLGFVLQLWVNTASVSDHTEQAVSKFTCNDAISSVWLIADL